MHQCENPIAQTGTFDFAHTRANAQKTTRAIFHQRTDGRTERISNIFYIEKRDNEK